MRDSFGNAIEVGDYVLSASTSGARVKMGKVFQGKSRLLIAVDYSAHWGEVEEGHQKTGSMGHNVIVLRKADGSVPTPMAAVYG